jgi:hypothetical protein
LVGCPFLKLVAAPIPIVGSLRHAIGPLAVFGSDVHKPETFCTIELPMRDIMRSASVIDTVMKTKLSIDLKCF